MPYDIVARESTYKPLDCNGKLDARTIKKLQAFLYFSGFFPHTNWTGEMTTETVVALQEFLNDMKVAQ